MTMTISPLVGLAFTLVTEQLLPGAHSHIPISRLLSPSPTQTATGDGLKVSVLGNGFALTTMRVPAFANANGLQHPTLLP